MLYVKFPKIKSNINQLVEGIHDETFLTACYEAVEGIAKAYRRISVKDINKHQTAQTNGFATTALEKTTETRATDTPSAEGEQSLPHDLSLVLLANELFKGSESLPEKGEIAYEIAFKKSLKTQPTLPNRL